MTRTKPLHIMEKYNKPRTDARLSVRPFFIAYHKKKSEDSTDHCSSDHHT